MDWETRTRCKAPGLMGAFQNLMSNPMFYVSIVQTIGDAYQRAKESGASEAQARWAAMGESLLNAGIELGGGVDEFVKKQAPAAWDILRSGLEEGLEEVRRAWCARRSAALYTIRKSKQGI